MEPIAAIGRRPNCYALLDEHEAMRAAVADVLRLRPDFSGAMFTARASYKYAADRQHLASSLREAGLPG